MNSLFHVSCILLVSIQAFAQTNVSGDIFTNTTWTKANSPYIVTDTIVVFPSYKLTIEPGVEVRFDAGMMLEMRQATLIAHGTSVDSITFTSNSLSPHPDSWGKIWLHGGYTTIHSEFSYCNFYYAIGAVLSDVSTSATIPTLTHSVFSFNGLGWSGSVIADSCDFIDNNVIGMSAAFGYGYAAITNCSFSGSLYGLIITNGNISNCSFSNNTIGVDCNDNVALGLCRFTNCIFNHNETAMYVQGATAVGRTSTCRIDSCIISNNMYGIKRSNYPHTSFLSVRNSVIDSNSVRGIHLFGYKDSVINCQVTHNGIGLHDSLSRNAAVLSQNTIENNTIGIKLRRTDHQITCNRICSNSGYDLYWTTGGNPDWPGNYWCSTDSAAIAARIYDGYDTVGTVNFMPVDTLQCYLGFSVSGTIVNESGIPVPGVTVTLSGDDTQTTTTGSDGRYDFSVAQVGNYTVTPSRNNDVISNNGITLMDVLLTRRHILGTPLSTPYKIIAADVDASNSVSTVDILLMRSMILQDVNSFNGRLWSFVPDDHVFSDILNPFPFPSARTYTNLQQSITNQDFIGIKLGDVNDSWDRNIP